MRHDLIPTRRVASGTRWILEPNGNNEEENKSGLLYQLELRVTARQVVQKPECQKN